MKGSMKFYNRLSIIACVGLLMLVCIQVFWIKETLFVQKEAYKQKLTNHAPALALDINRIDHSAFHGDSISLDNSLITEINEVVLNYINKNDLTPDLAFSLYQDTLGGVKYYSDTAYKEILLEGHIKTCMTCITSFSITKGVKRRLDETEEEFNMRLVENSEFQYFSPVFHESNINGKTLWLSIYQPSQWKKGLIQLLPTMIMSIILMGLLLTLIYYLLYSLSMHKKASQQKDDFFNNMTHEFKTPLSSIRLASKVLSQSNDAKKNITYHKLIEKESVELEKHVDRLLNLSLIENDHSSLDKTHINIHELLEDVVRRLEPLTNEKKAQILTNLNADTPTIDADPFHFSNCLTNIIENSLKYGGDGVIIKICTSIKNHHLTLSIEDNGPGIAKKYREYIFDRFYRANSEHQYKGQGFGIGLSYVKSVLKLHQSHIELDQNFKYGTKFIITIPYEKNTSH